MRKTRWESKHFEGTSLRSRDARWALPKQDAEARKMSEKTRGILVAYSKGFFAKSDEAAGPKSFFAIAHHFLDGLLVGVGVSLLICGKIFPSESDQVSPWILKSPGYYSTTEIYWRLKPKNSDELTKVNVQYLHKTISKHFNKAAQRSGRHQEDLLRALDQSESEAVIRGLIHSFKNGLIISDIGKIPEGIDLLKKKSNASDFLLNVLKLKETLETRKSVIALKEFLNTYGLKGAFLNPNLTHQEIRAIISSCRLLSSYLHELPGMLNAIVPFEKGIISREEFMDQVMTNLFHNGPEKGFWKSLSERVMTEGLMKSTEKKASQFFKDTVFQGGRANGMTYPVYRSPLGFLGVLHTIFDRLSQGTQGGVLKIWEEIHPFTPPIVAFQNLLFDNPLGTIEQLVALKTHVASLLELKRINLDQYKILINYIEKSQEREVLFKAYIDRFVQIQNEKGKQISIRYQNGETHIFSSTDLDPLLGNRLADAVERVLKEEEAQNGDAMKIFVRAGLY